jgi:diguanylate cyclase (GGDEF)-like protein
MWTNSDLPAFITLKLKLYLRLLLLGATTTALITLIRTLDGVETQVDDIIAPVMVVYCFGFYYLLSVHRNRFVQVFETSTLTFLFVYFFSNFALIIWRDADLALIDFGTFTLWLPLFYMMLFLILRSRTAVRTSLIYLGGIVAIGILHLMLNLDGPINLDNVFLLFQVYASNLLYIAILYIVGQLKDKYGEAELHSEQMTDLAMLDELTGIYNRRKFNDLLEAFIREYHETGRTFSIILLDVDGLKRINDQFGHPSGDRLLKRVAQVLQDNTRESDYVGRWGGDEFFIIYPDTDRPQLETLSGRLQAAIYFAEFGQSGPVTLSQGLATCNAQDTAESLWKRADENLYLAKSRRNSLNNPT